MTSDAKIEYLEVLQKRAEATQMILEGARKIADIGPSGIQEVAETHPEILLAAIVGLTSVVEMSWKEHLALVEDHFELFDDLESIKNDLGL